MKLAITIWETRVSPVFDSARRLLLVELDEGQIVRRTGYAVNGSPFAEVGRLHKEEGIELLLCGALCERGLQRLQAVGIELIPFLSGEVEPVLASLAAGRDLGSFAMPGCLRQCCCRKRAQAACPWDAGKLIL
ncbi:MAG: hypothetical protein M0O96_00785 [Desulforhopalus sp.]|nr:hypothetical protein [Desulforhopalus sp.]